MIPHRNFGSGMAMLSRQGRGGKPYLRFEGGNFGH